MMPALDLHLARRPRRLRATAALREIVRETRVHPADLILPLFVSEKITSASPSAPCRASNNSPSPKPSSKRPRARLLGVKTVLLFGIPAHKDEMGSGAYADDGVVQQAVRAIKAADPEVLVITDVCLCEYTSHGHCGVTQRGDHGHFHVLNDESVELLARTAVSHAGPGRTSSRPAT